jgi:hypothetical protein
MFASEMLWCARLSKTRQLCSPVFITCPAMHGGSSIGPRDAMGKITELGCAELGRDCFSRGRTDEGKQDLSVVFPEKTFHGSHRLDLVMIRPPGVDKGAFISGLGYS